MWNKITVDFSEEEFSLISELAAQEMWYVDDQVRFFVREALIRRGLLEGEAWSPPHPKGKGEA